MKKNRNERREVWRYGGIEVWRYGGIEVWRYGGMEVWRYGGMEVWRYIAYLDYFEQIDFYYGGL